MPDYEIESLLYGQGFKAVCGVDEAGRGPLCGPVVAAAVILAPGTEIPGLNDSKKLTAKKREALFDVICEKALAFGIAQGSVEEINALNILEADLLAMRRAIASLRSVSAATFGSDGRVRKSMIALSDSSTPCGW